MNALIVLYRLQGRAMARRATRGARSVKGALLLAFGVVIVGLWLAPSVWLAQSSPRTDPAQVLDAAPVLLLSACLLAVVTSGGEKAIAFTPAEVDFLFPGPFTRRQLLAYKLGKTLAGVVFSSLMLSAVLLRHAASWPHAWVALLLAMLFLQLFSMAVTLLAQSAGERAYTRGRKVVLALVVVAIAVAVYPYLKGGGRATFMEIARALRSSRVGAVLLAPLDVFGRLFVAGEWWPDGLKNAGLALGIDLALMAVVFVLDADYLEAAATKSQALHARLARVRKSGFAAIGGTGGKARGSVPMPPPWRGAGPVAWRQATTAIRNARALLFVLLIIAIGAGPVLRSAGDEHELAMPVINLLVWMTVIVASWFRFDFRGDLDQMDYLKSLPVSALALSAGQLVTPVLMMTACHWLIVGGVMIAARRADETLIAAAVLSVPLNLLLFSVENVIFLLMPSRTVAGPADLLGRNMLMLFAKMLILAIFGGIAGLAGYAVYAYSRSAPGAIGTAALLLTAFALATLPLVAWAFNRFDVAGDTPA